MTAVRQDLLSKTNKRRLLSRPIRFLRQAGVPVWVPYVFIIPFFLIFCCFMLYPILDTFILSFENWSTMHSTWVGLENYKLVVTDPAFWTSLLNDAFILLVQVPVMLFIATLLAVALNSRFLKLKWLFRLLIFFPVLVDAVTYTIAFQLIFNPNSGMMNYILHLVGITPVNWLENSWAARLAIFLVVTWRWTGYNAIIILSGLQTIPEEVYESAVMDGAGRVRTFFQITLPLLQPVLLFCTILSTVGTLQLFTEPYILTGGGPGNATETPMLYLYNIGFQNYNFGLASAGTYILTTIIAVLSYFQIRISRGGDYNA